MDARPLPWHQPVLHHNAPRAQVVVATWRQRPGPGRPNAEVSPSETGAFRLSRPSHGRRLAASRPPRTSAGIWPEPWRIGVSGLPSLDVINPKGDEWVYVFKQELAYKRFGLRFESERQFESAVISGLGRIKALQGIRLVE